MALNPRRSFCLSVVLLALAFSAPAWAAPVQQGPTSSEDAERSARWAGRGDWNFNRISDALEDRLARTRRGDRVNVIVTYSGHGDPETARRAVGDFDLHHNFRLIRGFSGSMTAEQVEDLALTPWVFRIDEDFEVSIVLDAANRDFGALAARDDYGVTGAGVGICIVDTGVSPNEQLDNGKIVDSENFVSGENTADDLNGHGTHVASTAAGDGVGGPNAAKYKGVAPGALIYNARVLDASGSGTASGVIAGIQWCAGITNVHIISMSLSGGGDGQDALSLAANAAVDQGKIVVVAAGNSGPGLGSVGSPSSTSTRVSSTLFCLNGGRPVNISYRMAPRLYTSLWGEISELRPAACSGAM